MEKIKLMTVVGTRPEIIRLSETIKLIDGSSVFDHKFVHTGQNYDYELNQIFFEDLELRQPDYYLDAVGDTAVQTIANIMLKIEPIIQKNKPDAFMVLGDTNSALSAIVAKKYKIPIFHLEAGNRCFDQRVPEEINRKIIDHISDMNLTYSQIAREYLLSEGFPADQIIVTGSPMKEVLDSNQQKIAKSNILNKLNLKKNHYFLVSSHREESVDNPDKLLQFINVLDTLVEMYDYPILFSTHPRTLNQINALNISMNPKIIINKPLNFTDYVHLQIHAKTVLSDSGTISEESSILNLNALNLREAHERPEAMEEAEVILTGYDKNRIIQGLSVVKKNTHTGVKDYNVDNFSDKIVRIIISYTDYIQRKTWKKYENRTN